MFETLENNLGLDIVLWFQQNRSPWLETLTQILDQLGYDLAYVALFGLIFWAINKQEGIRLIFALAVIGLLSFFFKDLLARPRPFMVSDLVNPVFEAEGFGIPSGHTSLAVMIWGYVALWVRKGWVWLLAITYMLLQGIGRIIAGVHFPQDVLAGAVLGIVTLAIYYPFVPRWEQFWRSQSISIRLMIAIIVPLILTVLVLIFPLNPQQIEAYLTVFGLALGVGIGTIIESESIQFQAHPQLWRRALHYILGIVLVVAILFGLSPLFDLIAETGFLAYILRIIRYGLAGFVAIAGWSWLGMRLNLLQAQRNIATVH